MQEQPTPPPKPQEGQGQQADATAWLTRRRLVRLGWITAGWSRWEGSSGCSSNSSLRPSRQAKAEDSLLLVHIDAFPVGSAKHFRRQRCIVAHHPTGMLALSDECTHQKCTVGYLPERQIISCPCHGAQFSTTGAVLAGPAPRPLDRFAITVQDGQIVVDTSQRFTAPSPG